MRVAHEAPVVGIEADTRRLPDERCGIEIAYADAIKLSSYEVAGLVWHFADADLAVAPWEELAIVAAADRNLAAMVGNQSRTMALKTPDGTRCVIDTQEKFGGLALLSFEVSQLREAIANELNPHLALDSAAQRRRLVEAYVP